MTEEDPELAEPDPWLVALGARLKQARDAAGMRQDAVHESLGHPTRSLTRWENGRSDPGFAKIAQLAELYGVSADWLAGRTTIRQCIRPGMVMIDKQVLTLLQELVDAKRTIDDVPKPLIRGPGIYYASPVPQDPDIVTAAAADTIESQRRELWKRLGGS